ncbi:hypothetical protein [Methylobacter sp. BlB1]|uniref:hypothetical protein n=1 Tax=Methylobacter sp. BlB1 TaxID=2785914 RepID=UPI00189612DB|nr:hypothetical protein [Methylobacter sp. BlB1]MBF6650433.1 hypothetical protein [Methylobacter sp. BlB1]
MFRNDDKTKIFQVAQQQAISRSDIATTKRAFQDLRDKTQKLQDTIWQLATNASDCPKDAFQDAWDKRQELNQINKQLTAMEELISNCMPKASTARLTEKERTEIKGLYQSGLYTQAQLADQYNVTQPTISDIIKK